MKYQMQVYTLNVPLLFAKTCFLNLLFNELS